MGFGFLCESNIPAGATVMDPTAFPVKQACNVFTKYSLEVWGFLTRSLHGSRGSGFQGASPGPHSRLGGPDDFTRFWVSFSIMFFLSRMKTGVSLSCFKSCINMPLDMSRSSGFPRQISRKRKMEKSPCAATRRTWDFTPIMSCHLFPLHRRLILRGIFRDLNGQTPFREHAFQRPSCLVPVSGDGSSRFPSPPDPANGDQGLEMRGRRTRAFAATIQKNANDFEKRGVDSR